MTLFPPQKERKELTDTETETHVSLAGDLLLVHQSVPHAGVNVRGAERVMLFDRDRLEPGGWHEEDRYESQTFWWEVCGSARGCW